MPCVHPILMEYDRLDFVIVITVGADSHQRNATYRLGRSNCGLQESFVRILDWLHRHSRIKICFRRRYPA